MFKPPGRGRNFWLVLSLAAFVTLFSVWSPHFADLENMLGILDQSSINIVVAVGMTLVVASAGIDLSVGAGVAMVGVLMATALKEGLALSAAIGAGLLAGGLIGVLNAFLIVKVRVTPFMATLTMMNLVAGATLILTQGIPIYGFSPEFAWIGRGKPGGVPVSVWIAGGVFLAGFCIVRFTRLGLYALALGSNEEALRRVGVPTGLYKGALYALSGVGAAVASVVLTAKLNSAEPLAGAMVEMNAIATVILGGTGIRGGRANMVGTLLAGLILGVLRNGLVLVGISSYYQQFATGLIILVAIVVSEVRRGGE